MQKHPGDVRDMAATALHGPSEVEIIMLFEEAARQYEECMHLADLADLSEPDEVSHPKYAWDNPIGLVITGQASAELV